MMAPEPGHIGSDGPDPSGQAPLFRPAEPGSYTTVETGSLASHVESLSSEITRLSDGFTDTISNAIAQSLQQTFGRAESALGRLVRESGLLDASSQDRIIDVQTACRRVLAFRRGVQKDLVKPIAASLSELDAGERISRMFDDLTANLASLAARVPEKLVRPEVPELYSAVEGDNPYVGLRKLGIRLQRRVTVWGGTKVRQQRVFLRTLVRAHTGAIIPNALSLRTEKGLHEIGLSIAGVERELTRLVHVLLRAEVDLDRSMHHVPVSAELPFTNLAEEGSVGAASAATTAGSETPAAERDVSHLEILDGIRTANTRVMKALESARSLSLKHWSSGFSGIVILSVDSLRRDIDRSDSFMVKKTLQNGVQLDSRPAGAKSARVNDRWKTWFRETVYRLQFVDALASIRDDLASIQASAVDGAFMVGLIPAAVAHAKTAVELRQLHDQAAQFFRDGLNRNDLTVMLDQLEKLLGRSVDVIESGIINPFQGHQIVDALSQSSGGTLDQINALAERLSETYSIHPLPEESDDRIDLTEDLRTIDLKTIVRQAVDETFPVDLRDAPQPLVRHGDVVLQTDTEILAIIRFNLGAAQEELEEGKTGRHGQESYARAVAAAEELTLNGLSRSADALLAERERLAPVGKFVVQGYFDVFKAAWEQIHEHARAESHVQKALVDARTAVSERSRVLFEQAGKGFDRSVAFLRQATQLGKRRAEQLVRMGQEAVGAQAQLDSAFQETMEALTGLDARMDAAPLVYRRLFSFHPLADPDLLEGRVEDKRVLVKHLQAWRKGIPQAFLITGAPSSGLTSFLNVMCRTIFRQSDVTRLDLTERITVERELVTLLADTLKISGPHPTTLFEFTAVLLAQPAPPDPPICIVEHLEHLFLRSIGGTKLVRDFLTMISRTDTRLLWILTIADFGWQLIEKSEPSAASLVVRHNMSPIDRDMLEKLVMKRHSRSGLNVHFLPPDEPNPLLARRLRRARNETVVQELSKEYFFDRLHIQCGENIMLSLFYWISSVSLNDEKTAMVVNPFSPMKFGFLSGYSLQQSLALKALLEHETLTIEEFSTVDRCSLESSMEIFESLGNALLIEPVDEGLRPGQFDFITVERETRYRIRPLIVYPIIQYLRGKNIVH